MKQYLFIPSFLFFLFLSNISFAQGETASLYVTNNGDIPIMVVCAKKSALAFGGGTVFDMNGWYTINPGGRVLVYYSGSIYSDYYLSFSRKDNNGNIGFVKYNLEQSYPFTIVPSKLELCASLDEMHDYRAPNCLGKTNHTGIPFYHKVSPQISYAPNHQNIEVELSPKATDRIVSYLNTNTTAKPDNTAPGKPEKRTWSAYQIADACKNSGSKYDEPWRRPKYCDCKAKTLYQSTLTNNDIAKLVKNWRGNYYSTISKDPDLEKILEDKCSDKNKPSPYRN